MDILLHTDILLEYFDGIFSARKNEIITHISAIVTNTTNSFILNRKIIDEYELKLNEHFDNNLDTIYPFLIELLSKKINVEIDDKSIDLYKDIEKCYLSKKEYSKSVIYSNVSHKRVNSLNNKYSCVLDDIEKSNIHWLISQLASLKSNSLTLRYFDFKSDDEIQELFDNLFKLSDRHLDVCIYDRQINFGHNLFNLIKNTHLIHYYTAFSREDYSDNLDIKSNFRRVKIFKIKRNLIHERKLIIKDLIIEADNDFWNLKCCEPTWKIDITLCEETAQKLISKNINFRRSLN